MSDKCNLCALKVTFDQDEVAKENEVDNFFTTLRDCKNISVTNTREEIWSSSIPHENHL